MAGDTFEPPYKKHPVPTVPGKVFFLQSHFMYYKKNATQNGGKRTVKVVFVL